MKKLLWIGCLSYFLIGLAHVVLGSILPVALEHYGKDYSQGGTLIFAQFAGFLGGVLLSPPLNRRFGKRGGLLIAAALLCIAELSYMLLPPWGFMFVIAPAAGFGFGMIEAVIGTIIIAAIKENTAVAMSKLEVLFGIGAMVMPLIASGLISAGYWRMSFLVVAVCSALTFLFWAKMSFGELDHALSRHQPDAAAGHIHAVESSDGESPAGSGTTSSTYRGRNLALMILFVVFFFLYVGTEMSLANFMPAILIEKMNMKEAGATLSVTCFWIAMSVGRLFAGYIAEKFQYRVYILYSCLAAVLLMAIFPFTNQIWSAFLIILLLGLAFSGVFSIALVFASKMLPGTEESTPSILIASGGVGGAILPLLTGWSLDHLDVNQSTWMLALFTAGLLVISLVAYQWQNRQRAASV
ncbi:MFS transporter [Paenibacillus sp. 7516]|uniref:MFS transporter n=1 Tax=Paenibacillus sp. 7516 TaxID=2022549 RepID=UPI000BA6942A|nr:MFS transporter [Paenibacillus sp. 7516]PAF29282.1 MFS transporter [Paenibacillus sp. 7516]